MEKETLEEDEFCHYSGLPSPLAYVEKTKQECTCDDNTCDYCDEQESIDIMQEAKVMGMKQQTLEEAADFYESSFDQGASGTESIDFIEGAKWQAEQDKNKYSEEEVLELILNRPGPYLSDEEIKEWFQKHKKK
jgi:hypothetical protein